MHCLTQTGQWEMRVDYQKGDKIWSYFHYNQFSVGSASAQFQLTVEGMNKAEFPYHNKKYFSTPGNDNDKLSSGNYAVATNTGWWHNACDLVNLNKQPIEIEIVGDMLFSEMKIRLKDYHIIQ